MPSALCRGLRASVFALLLLSWLASSISGQATEDGRWTDPQLLFENREGFSRLDYMTADASGIIHIFWSSNPNNFYGIEFDENETVIYYQNLAQGQWLESRDILLRSQAAMPFGAVIDTTGNLHLVTSVGGPPCLAYYRVSAVEAANPRAWPPIICLDAIGVGAPDIATAHDGVLYAIYPRANQKEIAVVKSLDVGHSWSPPLPVASIVDNDVNLGFPRLVTDDKGRLHATWGELQAPGGYPWQHILYSQSLDGGDSWSEPTTIADGNQGNQNLTIYDDTVHIVWNGDAGYQGRYYRSSNDGGVTWSERKTLPLPITSGGLQGAPAIVVDSTGTVHILYTDSQRLYYITQRDRVWSQPVQIAGPENTGSTSEINYPMLAITEGNQLHALYTRDAQAVYYQRLTIDAPAEAAIPWPTSLNPTATEGSAATPQPEPTAAPARHPGSLELASPLMAPSTTPTSLPLIVSILPAIVIVLGVVILRSTRLRR